MLFTSFWTSPESLFPLGILLISLCVGGPLFWPTIKDSVFWCLRWLTFLLCLVILSQYVCISCLFSLVLPSSWSPDSTFEPVGLENYKFNPEYLLLVVVCLFGLVVACKRHVSGGRPGQQKPVTLSFSTNPDQQISSPLLFFSPTLPLVGLQNLFTTTSNTTSTPATPDVNTKILESLEKLQQTMNLVLLQLSGDSVNVQTTTTSTPEVSNPSQSQVVFPASYSLPEAKQLPAQPPRTRTPISPELLHKMAAMSQEEVARELQLEAQKRRQQRKQPVYLSEAEKAMSTTELFQKLYREQLTTQDEEFLASLPILPPDVRQWSLADIKRWFRDTRHEQWAVRQLQLGRTLFICPVCNKVRDADAHRCVPLWSRPVPSRSGVPLQQQALLTRSGRNTYRISQQNVVNPEQAIAAQNRLAAARNSTIEANTRLARALTTAQDKINKETTPNVTTPPSGEQSFDSLPPKTEPEETFPYAQNIQNTPYHQQLAPPPVYDLTGDEDMDVTPENAVGVVQARNVYPYSTRSNFYRDPYWGPHP